MASIKVKFKPSTVADHEGTIYYQILHERKQRQLFSDYPVFSGEWDENRSMVTTTQKSERKPFILSIRERIRWDVERLKPISELDYARDKFMMNFMFWGMDIIELSYICISDLSTDISRTVEVQQSTKPATIGYHL